MKSPTLSFIPTGGPVYLISFSQSSFSFIRLLPDGLASSFQAQFSFGIPTFSIFLSHHTAWLVPLVVWSILLTPFTRALSFFAFLTFAYQVLSLSFSWTLLLSFFRVIFPSWKAQCQTLPMWPIRRRHRLPLDTLTLLLMNWFMNFETIAMIDFSGLRPRILTLFFVLGLDFSCHYLCCDRQFIVLIRMILRFKNALFLD